MREYIYRPPAFNFNRLCHRLVGLFKPESTFTIPRLEIVIPQEVIVPDSSTYESRMNIDLTVVAGAKGIIARGGQGIIVDDQFLNTWTAAKGKLPRGVYWFYDPRIRPADQVAKFVSLIQTDPGELDLFVDWEYPDSWGGSYQGWQNLKTFLELLKSAMPGRKIGIYTGYYYWLDHSPNPLTQAGDLAYFSQFDLWLAWYADQSVVRIPKPWTTLTFWQFTENGNGTLYGASSMSIDLSYYAGTYDQYVADYNLNGTTPGGNVTSIIKGTAKGVVNIRKAPAGDAFFPPRYLYTGDVIEADKNSAQWLHLTKINNVLVTDEEWASAGSSQQYIAWAWVDVPVPPPPPPSGVVKVHQIDIYTDGSLVVDGNPIV